MHTSHTRFSAHTQAPLFGVFLPKWLSQYTRTHVHSQTRCDGIFTPCALDVRKFTQHARRWSVLICPSAFEFMTTEVVPSSFHDQSGERVKLMSHGGREGRRRKTRAERRKESVSQEEEGFFQKPFWSFSEAILEQLFSDADSRRWEERALEEKSTRERCFTFYK